MNRPIHRILCLHALVVAFLIPGQAQAQAFLFNVPLDLKDIHPTYTVVKVTCRVDGQDAPVGEFSNQVTLVAGAFHGTLSVPVEPGRGKSALDARSYTCEASYCMPGGVNCTSAIRQSTPATMVQPGAPFTPSVSGLIQ